MIKYYIEKEEKTPEVNPDINIQDILQEVDDKLQTHDPVDEIDHELPPYDLVDDIYDTSEDFPTGLENIDDYFIPLEDEDDFPLTPEMEQANIIFDEAMKLINGTGIQQYSA